MGLRPKHEETCFFMLTRLKDTVPRPHYAEDIVLLRFGKSYPAVFHFPRIQKAEPFRRLRE